MAAVAIPEFGKTWIYADTYEEKNELIIHNESKTEDLESADLINPLHEQDEGSAGNEAGEHIEAEDNEVAQKTEEGIAEGENSTETVERESKTLAKEIDREESEGQSEAAEDAEEKEEKDPKESKDISGEEKESQALPESEVSVKEIIPEENPDTELEEREEKENAFAEKLAEDSEEPTGDDGLYIEEEYEEEPTFAKAEESLAGAKKGELPVKGGIVRIQLLKNGDTASGSEDGYVITWPASDSEKQKFFVDKIGKNWRFVNTVTGKALVVTEPDGNGGRFVALEEPTGGKRELWRIETNGKGYSIKSVIDGRVLTAARAGNGEYVLLTDGKGVSRQRWTFTACQESIEKAEITVDANVGSGAKNLIPETKLLMGGRVLKKDVDYTLTGGNVAGTANLLIQGIGNFSGIATRSYEIVEAASEIMDGGFYMLIPKQNTSFAMSAESGGMINGTDIVAEQRNGSEQQIFQVKRSGNDYVFTNAKSSKVLAPSGNGKGADISLFAQGKGGSEVKAIFRANGAFVLRSANGRYLKNINGRMTAANKKITDGAYFYLVPVSGPSMTFSDTYYIRTMTRIRLVAGISGSSKANEASAILTNYSDIAAQRFEFLYSGDGYYRIVSARSRKVLTANADGTVVQRSWTGDYGQRWKPVASVGGYLIKNAAGNVLTVIGDYVKNGRSLGVDGEDGSTKQIFLLLARGSGEAKKNLVKKPLTIYNGTDYAAVYNYDDYMDRYTNLANEYGTDCLGALKYFVENGMREGQHGSDDFDVWCYRRSNPGVRRELLADIPSYYLHYIRIGKAQGLKASGPYQTTQAASLHDLAWRCYNEWGDYANRPNSREMCEILSAAAEVQYQAYGFPKSIVIAMAIKECGFLTFNAGLPPTSNNVLTMNVDMWNGKWRSGWLGGYAVVKVPQYDSAIGQLVYGYEPVRCYEDIEACMDDFANFKTTLLGSVPAGMSIESVVDKYLEGYATSPGYKQSILATIKLHQLTRFDH